MPVGMVYKSWGGITPVMICRMWWHVCGGTMAGVV